MSAYLVHNTVVSLQIAIKQLPQYNAQLAELQREMYSTPAPTAERCIQIINEMSAMYTEYTEAVHVERGS